MSYVIYFEWQYVLILLAFHYKPIRTQRMTNLQNSLKKTNMTRTLVLQNVTGASVILIIIHLITNELDKKRMLQNV
jgi:hypothetical protein